MTTKEVREVLGIPGDQRIGQYIWSQSHAHDYSDFFYMPDDVFIAILKDKPDFARVYRETRMK